MRSLSVGVSWYLIQAHFSCQSFIRFRSSGVSDLIHVKSQRNHPLGKSERMLPKTSAIAISAEESHQNFDEISKMTA